MKFQHDNENKTVAWGLAIIIALFALFSFFASQFRNPALLGDNYENIVEKKRVLAEMRVQLHKSVEMEKNAVMAPTDAQSRAFADQSRRASAAVEDNLTQLRALIETVPLQAEKRLVTEFGHCWTEFVTLDQAILDFALQSSNIRATTLSSEKGSQLLKRFEQALAALKSLDAGAAGSGQATLLADQALIAALKLYTLHTPHIAAVSDELMDTLEAQMQAEQRVAEDDLEKLAVMTALADQGQREVVQRAQTIFADFIDTTATILSLSRQNSNVKSLELSLGKKRTITAQCDDILAAFQEVMQSKTFKATR